MWETSESLFEDLWSVFTSSDVHNESLAEDSPESSPTKMYVESVERLQISSDQLERITDSRWSHVKVAQSGMIKYVYIGQGPQYERIGLESLSMLDWTPRPCKSLSKVHLAERLIYNSLLFRIKVKDIHWYAYDV